MTKGSTVGRRAGPGSTVMKDLNLLESDTKLARACPSGCIACFAKRCEFFEKASIHGLFITYSCGAQPY